RLALERLEDRHTPSTFTVNDSSGAPLDPTKGPGMTTNGTFTLPSVLEQNTKDGGGDTVQFAVGSAAAAGTSARVIVSGLGVQITNGGLTAGPGSQVSGVIIGSGNLSVGDGSSVDGVTVTVGPGGG